jgi:hypothetical protein
MKKIFLILTSTFLLNNLIAQNNLIKDDGDNTTPLPSGSVNSIISETSGNIGINSPSPGSQLTLDCEAGASKQSMLDIYNGPRIGGAYTYPFQAPYLLKVGHSATAVSYHSPPTTYPLLGLPVNRFTDFVITGNDAVGVGTDNPIAMLDVVGSARFRIHNTLLGNTYLNGNNEFNGTSEFNEDVTFNHGGSALISTFKYVNFFNQSTNFRCMNTSFGSSPIPGAYSSVTFNDVPVYFNPTNTIYFNGKVPHLHIGLLKPSGTDIDAIFSVDGKMVARHCKIQIDNWADDVFNKDYKLINLKEVEQFIQTNKHLPNIPSEKEVLENGIDLGEMNANLLRKVEELTLYLIELNKEIELLKLQIK